MIHLVTEISADLIEPLEEYFCEWSVSPWMIIQVKEDSPVFLHGYFESEELARDAWLDVSSQFDELPEEPQYGVLEDEDWKESYKKHFQPWQLENLHWIPEWERDNTAIPEGHAAVYLDPGMAFGTGDHPTTRLMARSLLEYYKKIPPSGRSYVDIIDAGCGSGILALSAYKLGFSNVYGFDRDAEAARVSEENAAANHIAGEIDFAELGLEDGLKNRQADFMMANIQADILCVYAENILQAIKPGGTLALSGILANEVNKTQAHFDSEISRLQRTANARQELEAEWAAIIYEFKD